MIIKLLVIKIVEKVTIIEVSHESLAINLALMLAQFLVQGNIKATLLKTIPLIMIVIDHVMINIIKTPPHVHINLLAPIIFQPHLIVYINLTFVRVNAPLVIITSRSHSQSQELFKFPI